jgi:hypothetical protein
MERDPGAGAARGRPPVPLPRSGRRTLAGLVLGAALLAGCDVWTIETPVPATTGPEPLRAAGVLELRAIPTGHDRARDGDVPAFTDVTLPGIVPDLRDSRGRAFAVITLYNVEPPLSGLPSGRPGVDRGLDMSSPATLVKSAYANYVSPVMTNDAERLPVPAHPIGHFYVKAEIPGQPPILTGMTSTARADAELIDLTLGRRLGIGGALLTPQPGRLNTAAEAMRELSLRQRELLVVDGLGFAVRDGMNVGPKYILRDGNVVFARFRVPVANADDALAFFAGFVARGDHDVFGSLIGRPWQGTGAGCAAFAMCWLKAAGVIPFVDETGPTRHIAGPDHVPRPGAPFWEHFYTRVHLPWDHVGCDARIGLAGPPQEARLTVEDALFEGLRAREVVAALDGLAAAVRQHYGPVAGSAIRYGARTPLREVATTARRKDPRGQGSYDWAAPGEGFAVGFWDNGRFTRWVKAQWSPSVSEAALAREGIRRVREGRFRGVEVDAMDAPRQREDFFARAVERDRLMARVRSGEIAAATCREALELWRLD